LDITYSPYDERLRGDPWPVYRRLQDEAPAYYIPDLDCWALSRFEDVWQASMDRQSYTATRGTSPDALFLGGPPPPEVFLFMDPPDHGVHRGLIARPYGREKMPQIEQSVRALVRELMAPELESGWLDVYRLASRTALFTIAGYIGLAREEILHIRGLIDLFYAREPGVRGTTPRGQQAFLEARETILGLIARYRARPPAAHTHIATWLSARIAERALTDEQIFFSLFAMVITGSDTVPLTTAAAVRYLERDPVQLALLRDDPSLAGAAFEEAARYDQPTNLLGRTVRQEIALHGQTLRPGQAVLFLYAAACRDPREFEAPDRFDVTRVQRRILSFGTGVHFCLGQHLARLEGRILLEEILAAIPEFEVDDAGLRRIDGEFLQGFRAMPIRFAAR
jgi:cytochrome P450